MKKKWGYMLLAGFVLLGLCLSIIYGQKIAPPAAPTLFVEENEADRNGQDRGEEGVFEESVTGKGVRGETAAPNPPTPNSAKDSPGIKEEEKSEAPKLAPAETDPPIQESVAIAVVGLKGEVLLAPTYIALDPEAPDEMSVIEVLKATGLSYKMSPKFRALVISIAGLANQGASGWMYQVNGETPMAAASAKKVSAGDRIIWWYSENPADSCPSWEALTGP